MPTEQLTIATDAGHALSGSLELPDRDVRGCALFAHCFTCTKQSRAAVALSRALAARGIATLRFDFTGLGGSEGEFGRAGFTTDIADLVVAARYLVGRFGGRLLLVGHSLGGAAVLAAADDIGAEHIGAIATIGAPADVHHVLGNLKGDVEAIAREGEAEVTIGGRPFSISREFVERAEQTDLLDEVARLRKPLMILHAPTDTQVGIENAEALFKTARHPKSFVSLDRADHLLTDSDDAGFAAAVIAAWAGRYLGID